MKKDSPGLSVIIDEINVLNCNFLMLEWKMMDLESSKKNEDNDVTTIATAGIPSNGIMTSTFGSQNDGSIPSVEAAIIPVHTPTSRVRKVEIKEAVVKGKELMCTDNVIVLNENGGFSVSCQAESMNEELVNSGLASKLSVRKVEQSESQEAEE